MLEKAAHGGMESGDSKDSKRSISRSVPKKTQTDDDNDYDFDLFYRYETTTPIILPRAEIVEINEEDENVESEEEAFYGFDLREVEEALELQAIFRGADAEEVEKEEASNVGLGMENAEIEEIEIEESPKWKKNLSPKERRKRKAAAN